MQGKRKQQIPKLASYVEYSSQHIAQKKSTRQNHANIVYDHLLKGLDRKLASSVFLLFCSAQKYFNNSIRSSCALVYRQGTVVYAVSFYGVGGSVASTN